MAEPGFRPYEGDKPYIFVSYAHANSAAVMEVIGGLHRRGYRIWYDEGIELGSEWPECIASHLAEAKLVLAFISNAYMSSSNCRREMHYALSKGIKTVNIFLEETGMSPGMEMQIGNIFALMKFSMSEELFYEKLYSAPLLSSAPLLALPEEAGSVPGAVREEPPGAGKAPKAPKAPKAAKKPRQKAAGKSPLKKKRLKRALLLVLLLLLLGGGISLGLVAHFTGLGERLIIRLGTEPVQELPGDTEAVFESGVLEAAARDYAGISQGPITVSDLIGLRCLYIQADSYGFGPGETAGHGLGTVESLADLAWFPDLETLYLDDLPLRSLESLPRCGVQYLYINDCPLSSLQGLGQLPKLMEIRAENCPVSRLGDIERCLELRQIVLTGSGISDFSSLKPLTELAELTVSNCTMDELGTVLNISNLKKLSLYNCDLRGSFFKALDRERGLISLELWDCRLDSTVNLEDFTGLTTLTLVNSGTELDWSGLRELPSLSTVYAGEGEISGLGLLLEGSGVSILPAEDREAEDGNS